MVDKVEKARIALSHARACIATEQGDFAEALEEFQKEDKQLEEAMEKGYSLTEAQKNQKKRVILGGIANSYQGLGDQLKAEANYERCLKLGKKDDINSSYEVNICRSMWARGAHDQAAARLNELIALRNAAKGTDDEADFMLVPLSSLLD